MLLIQIYDVMVLFTLQHIIDTDIRRHGVVHIATCTIYAGSQLTTYSKEMHNGINNNKITHIAICMGGCWC